MRLWPQETARKLGISLTVTRPLSEYTDTAQQPLSLQLAGAHQEQNASLAVALAASWEGSDRGGSLLARTSPKGASLPNGTTAPSNGHSAEHAGVHESGEKAMPPESAMEHAAAIQACCLPSPYISGLRNVSWPGRNQVCVNPSAYIMIPSVCDSSVKHSTSSAARGGVLPPQDLRLEACMQFCDLLYRSCTRP